MKWSEVQFYVMGVFIYLFIFSTYFMLGLYKKFFTFKVVLLFAVKKNFIFVIQNYFGTMFPISK